jgi:hypothetical protein
MDREEFINFVETKSKKNMKKDPYGNYKGTSTDGTVVRYKLQKNSVRYERQYSYESFEGREQKDWVRIWSHYYKDLEYNPETGKLRVIKKE